MERKADRLEAQQQTHADTVKSLTESNKYYFTLLSVIVGVVVAVQSFLQFYAFFHERGRALQRDAIEHQGARKVAEILGVIHDLTQAQFMERTKDRKTLEDAQTAVTKLQGDLDLLTSGLDKTTEATRTRLEDLSAQLVKTPRHEFRRLILRLEEFVRDFDRHLASVRGRKEELDQLSARAIYVRGIAAHYTNDPINTKEYLSRVVRLDALGSGETVFDVNKRLANAYYYLGVNESNFGQYGAAINYFDEANKRDADRKDFLSKVVTAEALIMNGDFDSADQYISRHIEAVIRDLEQQGELRQSHRRHESRTALLRANVAFKTSRNWPQDVELVLTPVRQRDPAYYYATATLAQAAFAQNGSGAAETLFEEAYLGIEASGDLVVVREARSRILLLMVSAMCAQHVRTELARRSPGDYLDEARRLLDDLPRRDNIDCTVFSPLTKQNELKSTIAGHIALVEAGHVLQEARSS